MSHEHGHSHGHGHAFPEERDERWSTRYWDDRYASRPALWSGRVNAVVAAEVEDLAVGRALEVACGEGADAIWLAEQGWQVTGVDISQIALDRAAAEAGRRGLGDRTTWELRDLLAWTPPEASFDLVTVGFLHLFSAERRRVYAGLANAVAPDGTLLVLAHHPSDLEVVPRPPEPDLFFEPEDLVADLPGAGDGWVVEKADKRPREQKHPETGQVVTVHDTVLRARRVSRPVAYSLTEE